MSKAVDVILVVLRVVVDTTWFPKSSNFIIRLEAYLTRLTVDVKGDWKWQIGSS